MSAWGLSTNWVALALGSKSAEIALAVDLKLVMENGLPSRLRIVMSSQPAFSLLRNSLSLSGVCSTRRTMVALIVSDTIFCSGSFVCRRSSRVHGRRRARTGGEIEFQDAALARGILLAGLHSPRHNSAAAMDLQDLQRGVAGVGELNCPCVWYPCRPRPRSRTGFSTVIFGASTVTSTSTGSTGLVCSAC